MHATSSLRLRGRKPANRQRSAGRALATSAASAAEGPGNTSTARPAATHARTSTKPGSRDERHPGVGDERDNAAGAHALDQLGGPLGLVVLVVADELGVDAVAIEQDPGATRVLAGDDIGFAQGRENAEGDVLEVADRGRADDQAAGAHRAASRASIPSKANAAAPTIPASTPNRAATISTMSVGRAQRPLRDDLARGGEEQLAGGDHAAADDDDLRVEDVHVAGDRRPRGGCRSGREPRSRRRRRHGRAR